MKTHNCKVVAPPKRLTVSQWADSYRYLSSESSSESGKWSTSRAEYQRGIMDAFSDPSIHTVVWMSSAQVGKTEGLNNVVGYFVDQDPSPMLLLQPTLDMGQAWSKDRLAPMLRDTPALKNKIADSRSRDSGNTILHKPISIHSDILTDNGFIKFGDIKIGDIVFDENGKKTKVISKTDIHYDTKCYEITFSDGSKVKCDENHLWNVNYWAVDKKPKPHQVLKCKTALTKDILLDYRLKSRYKYSIQSCDPLDFEEDIIPKIDPYFLGLWLGDGNSHNLNISTSKEDYLEIIELLNTRGIESEISKNEKIIKVKTKKNDRCKKTGKILKSTDRLYSEFYELDLFSKAGDGKSKKHIPNKYKKMQINYRIELLRGLMDSDGSIRDDGLCIFTNVSKKLIDDVVELLNCLGVINRVKEVDPSRFIREHSTHKTAQKAYRVEFITNKFSVFNLKRKKDREVIRKKREARSIVDIKEVKNDGVMCITVSNDSHLFLINRELIPTHNSFQGGHITIAGANSPASLASRPVRVVLCDEIDRYPNSAGAEGDPVSLAFKRTTTFWNKKRMLTSTPTIKGASRIEMAYEESDMRRYHVPCPECSHHQTLKWSNVVWEKDDPQSARYSCENCGSLWSDTKRWGAVKKGTWIAERETKGIAGFHLNEIYSPWVSLSDMVTNFLEAKKSKETLKTFVNTSLGETWEEEGLQLDDNELMNRREDYMEVPSGALVLVAGCDVQDDRIEIEVKGFGIGEESWSIDYKIIYGDPSKQNVWQDLDNALLQQYQNEDGYTMRIASACIDSGGHFTDAVYKFVKNKESRRIYAIKGSSTAGAPLVNRGTRSNKGNVKLFSVGTDTAKELIFARLKIEEFGQGYMHFAKHNDEEYFKQLTAEKLTTKFIRGFPSRVWTKTRPRNEALDLNVYALAALAILNPNWQALQSNIAKKTQPKEEEPIRIQSEERQPFVKPNRPQKQRGGWVKNY